MRFCKKAGMACYTMRRRFLRLTSSFVLIPALLLSVPSAEDQALAAEKKTVIYAGYRTLSSSLPAERLMLRMGVWYPAKRRPGVVKIADWNFRAARNAPVMEGMWPVIVLSHDVTGDAWAHHEIAAALARRGFIVAAPTHDYDNADDMRLLFSDRELPLRAVQVRSALDVVLENEYLRPKVDKERIGFLGFGLTAPSGFLLAGAVLSPKGWSDFIQEQKADNKGSARKSPWFQPYLAQRMEQLVRRMEHRAEERRQKADMMQSALASRELFFQRLDSSLERSHRRILRQNREMELPQPPVILPLLPPLSHDRAVTDERFKALALVSPGFSMLFSPDSFAQVQKPVLIIGAGRDSLLLPGEQAERFAAMLPFRPDYKLFAEATASMFQNTRGDDISRTLFGITADKEDPAQRVLLREQLLNTLQDFFHRSFGIK